jgi:hypothetical protein
VNGDHMTCIPSPLLSAAASDVGNRDIVELNGHRYVRQNGLARMLGVTVRTLFRWDERRIGPPKIKVGKLVLYDLAKLHGWLEGHEGQPVGGPRQRRRS